MKKTNFFLFTGLLWATIGFSQTQKGGLYLAGNLSFGTHKGDASFGGETKVNLLDTRMGIGQFLAENFALGAAVNYSRVAQPAGDKPREITTQLLATARYYAGTGKARIFLAGELGLAYYKYSYLTYDKKREKNLEVGGAFGIGAGVAYFLTPNVAFEGLVGLQSYSLSDQESATRFTGLRLGVTAYWGSEE